MSAADTEDVSSVKAWLARWQPCVRAADYGSARALFDDRVVSFGTHRDVVSGLDALEQGQWRNVWGRIDGFAWDFDAMHVGFSPDRLLAFLAATWTSVGYHEDGSSFHRPGRTTAILSRPGSRRGLGVHPHPFLALSGNTAPHLRSRNRRRPGPGRRRFVRLTGFGAGRMLRRIRTSTGPDRSCRPGVGREGYG